MAKTPRTAYPELPLSAGFYALLAALGADNGLPLADTERLARAVAELSRVYTRERSALATGALAGEALLARLGFFLPRDLVKLFGPLGELVRARHFPVRESLRVLDLGAGLGASTLGLARFLRHAGLDVHRLEVTALERDLPAGRLMRALCAAVSALPDEFTPLGVTLHTGDLHALPDAGSFDLVLLGFVLNELYLDQPPPARASLRARLLRRLCARLAPDGALIVLEPALRESTRELMQARDALLEPPDAPFVFAPCVHARPCPMLGGERDWCHETLDFGLPPTLAQVARAAGLRHQGLSYAALVLSPQPRRFEVRGAAPDAELYRIVSDRLPSKGKLELYGCAQSGYLRLTRLDRDASAANRGFEQLRRGDVTQLPAGAQRVERGTQVPKW